MHGLTCFQAFYADAEERWDSVVDTNRDCRYKISKSNYAAPLQTLVYPITLRVKGQRPRWWYITVANCQDGQIDMSYELNFTNEGDGFSRQFPKDEQGIIISSIP